MAAPNPPTAFEVQQVYNTRSTTIAHTTHRTFFSCPQWMAENGDLLEAAHERLNLGRLHESLQFQLQLQQNLLYLGTHADDEPALERVRFARRQQQPEPEQPEAAAEANTASEAENAEPAEEEEEQQQQAAEPTT